MIKKLSRWFLPSLFAVFLVLFFATPVLAIDEPDAISIDGVWVYQNCRETGDQLYLVSYNITYTSPPTEDVSEAYLVRLMDGATELRAVAPYAYHDDGYGSGVAAIYFDSEDAPTWQGAYTMKLMGNPLLSWNASAPEESYSAFDVWQDNDMAITKVVVSGRIIELAGLLETAWGEDMTNLSDTGQDVLTAYGLAYFINVVPYFSEIAPYVFAEDEGMGGGIIHPEIPPEEDRTGFADQLVTLVSGTSLDLSPLGDWLGVATGAITTVIYYGLVLYIVIRLSREGKSTRPMMLLSIPLVCLGAYVGVPLIVTVLAGLFALFFTLYAFLFKPSPV